MGLMYNTANYEPKRPIHICHSFLLAVGPSCHSSLLVASSSQGGVVRWEPNGVVGL